MDLVVVSLAHPPGPQPIDRLSSGFSQILRRCPRPVLAIPQRAQKVARLLLAYDHSSTSKEAMFIAAYLAKAWSLPLTVVTVTEGEDNPVILRSARDYLDQKVISADFIAKQGKAASNILQVAGESECDLIIMGSYGHNPLLEIALGSTVDEILRVFEGATLICR
jgi:nucleotide-binding universal stress UspA family protein